MTRINVGVPVEKLTNKHLIAEHREIKRVPNCVKKGRFNLAGQPKQFKLGPGHVKFFYDKLGYLFGRYQQLYSECVKRKFKVQNYSGAWDGIPEEYMNDYSPTKKDISIVKKRIKERTK